MIPCHGEKFNDLVFQEPDSFVVISMSDRARIYPHVIKTSTAGDHVPQQMEMPFESSTSVSFNLSPQQQKNTTANLKVLANSYPLSTLLTRDIPYSCRLFCAELASKKQQQQQQQQQALSGGDDDVYMYKARPCQYPHSAETQGKKASKRPSSRVISKPTVEFLFLPKTANEIPGISLVVLPS